MIIKVLIAWFIIAFLAWALCRGGDCDDVCSIQVIGDNNEIEVK